MKRLAFLGFGAAFFALAAGAQPAGFSCVGAEKLENDVFSIAFARGSATIPEAARSPLAAAVEAALAETGRNICILGHAGQEAGLQPPSNWPRSAPAP